MRHRGLLVETAVVTFFLLLFFVQAQSLLYYHSLSFDEHAHVASGYIYLKTGIFPGGWNNPPFGQTLLGLPYALGLAKYDAVSGIPPYAGRAVNVFLGIFLGLGIYFFSRSLFGFLGATLSLALFSLSPLLVAYSTIATTDLPVSVFPLFFLYCLYRSHKGDGLLWLIAAGAFLAFAASCKNNALIIVILAPFILLARSVKEGQTMGTFLKGLFILFFCAWFFFCATHCFQGCFQSKSNVHFAPLRLLAPILPTKAVKSVSSHLDIAAHGRETYLYGQYKLNGFLSYYPLMFLMKSPLGTLILFFSFLFIAIVARHRESKAELYYLWFPGGAYFFLTTAINAEQVGLRHAMIFHPILYVAMGLLGKEAMQRKWLRGVIILAIAINLFTIVSIHPLQMSFLNHLAWNVSQAFPVGGPDLDWGQEDRVVEEYLEKLPEDRQVQIVPYPRCIPRTGHIAVNVEVFMQGPDRYDFFRYDWLKEFTPKSMIGNSWFHFVISEQDMEALANRPLHHKMAHYIYLSYHFWNGRYGKVIEHAKKMELTSNMARSFLGRALLLQKNAAGADKIFATMTHQSSETIYSWDDWGPWAMIAKLYLEIEKAPKPVDLQLLAHLGVMLHSVDKELSAPLLDELLNNGRLSKALDERNPKGLLRLLKAQRYARKREYPAILELLKTPLGLPVFQASADRLVEMAETQIKAEQALNSDAPLVFRINHVWKSLLFQVRPDEVWKRMLALHRKYPFDYEVIRHLNMIHMLRRGFGCYNVRYDTGANLLYDRVDAKTFVYRKKGHDRIGPTK